VKHLAGAAPSLQRITCINSTDRLVAGESHRACFAHPMGDRMWDKQANSPINQGNYTGSYPLVAGSSPAGPTLFHTVSSGSRRLGQGIRSVDLDEDWRGLDAIDRGLEPGGRLPLFGLGLLSVCYGVAKCPG
jgi:hypothetical protein